MTRRSTTKTLVVSDFDATVLGGYFEFFDRAFFRFNAVTAVNPLGWRVAPSFQLTSQSAQWAAYAAYRLCCGRHRPGYDYGSTRFLRERLVSRRGFTFDVGLWTLLLHMQVVALGYDFALCTGHVDLGVVTDALDFLGEYVSMDRLRTWTRRIHSELAFGGCRELGLVARDAVPPALPEELLLCVAGDKGLHVKRLFGEGGYDRCLFIDDTQSRLDEVWKAFDAAGMADKLDLVNAAPPLMRGAAELRRVASRCPGTCAQAFNDAVRAFWSREQEHGERALLDLDAAPRFLDFLSHALDVPSREDVRLLLRSVGAKFIVPAQWLQLQPAAAAPEP